MALIKCPECGKEVSDKASACINCGYPLDELKDELTETCTDLFTYGTSAVDVGDMFGLKCEKCNKLLFIPKNNFETIKIDEYVISKIPIKCSNCNNEIPPKIKIPSLYYRRGDNKEIQKLKEANGRMRQSAPQPQPTQSLPNCPRCGSTSITTGPRGVNGFWGFIGASKTVNRCANCGNTWTPKI